MKKFLFTSIVIILSISAKSQGDNCSAPKEITICPETAFVGETTAGYTNDVTGWRSCAGCTPQNSPGNDVVYKLNVPTGTQHILVTIKNASASLRLYGTGNICNGYYTSLYTAHAAPATNNFNIYVGYFTGPLYFWIDHSNTTDVTYDITFGAITKINSVTFVKGTLQTMAGCITGSFKPDLHITYNGMNMPFPLVYPSLGTPGVVCSRTMMRNLTGSEGVKQFRFTFDSDITNPSPAVATMPGFYNAGTWVATQSGNVITWNFIDAAGKGKGDFTGTPNSCLIYTFCHNITPVSNNPATTNIRCVWTGDNWGPSKNTLEYQGCSSNPSAFYKDCASLPCTVPGSTSTAAATGSFGFNDPFLPVELISFDVKKHNNKAFISWQTATEHNSERFEIERSTDGVNFYTIGIVAAAGFSDHLQSYSFEVAATSQITEYYRLRIVDKDGTEKFSRIVTSQAEAIEKPIIYPNPARSVIHEKTASAILRVSLCDVYNNAETELLKSSSEDQYKLPDMEPGVYLLKVLTEKGLHVEKTIVE
ncbi:MAG: T9SS type A sorting domain-containing protein [Cytophagaceae bacterium]|nr:T9SS type A sorting domain-containing protein [Cytophagaceae bacterium]MDW8457030.1 T9SS type A sorting domain-containing protein [Cytophagaceae bacterium]